jgi:hypothetical protein
LRNKTRASNNLIELFKEFAMKKIFVLFVLFFLAGSVFLSAQTPKPSIGGGLFFTNYIGGGGFADTALSIYNRGSFDIRNHIVFRGAGMADEPGGFFSLSEKISIGGLLKNKFRGYGYIEGGIGLWGNENKAFFGMPLAYTFGGGGGTDIFLSERFGIFFEAGALIYVFDNAWKSGGMFQIGWKGYF